MYNANLNREHQSMNLSLNTKIKERFEANPKASISINGLNYEQWLFLFNKFIEVELFGDKKHQVFVFELEEDAEKFYALSKGLNKTLYYPDLGNNIFSGVFSSERNLNDRLLCLNKLYNSSDEKFYIVTTYSALMLKAPPKEFFTENSIQINVSDILPPQQLSEMLNSSGYRFSPTTEEPGTFSRKGEIFDIFPLSGEPFRIHYFDEMIEEIFLIDRDNLRTLRDKPLQSFEIYPMAGSALRPENTQVFRDKLPRPPLSHKLAKETREDIFDRLTERDFFPNYPLFFSLFFENNSSLLELCKDKSQFHFFNQGEAEKAFELKKENLIDLYEENLKNTQTAELLPAPEELYKYGFLEKIEGFDINSVSFQTNLDQNYTDTIDIGIEDFKTYVSHQNIVSSKGERSKFLKTIIESAIKASKGNSVFILYRNDSSLSQLKGILDPFLTETPNAIKFERYDLTEGFIYKNENLFILSEADFFIHKVTKTKKSSKRNRDVFAEQIASLQVGDFVIHKSHGVGKYLGMETINLGSQTGDFLVIEYHDGDKVYLPVYKLDLIQKHSSSTGSVKVANLKTKKFEQEKARASKSVKKLAFDLLEVQAKRELKRGFKFSEPDDNYREFEAKFPFQETEDQIKAIEDVLDDMTSDRPMDRLICGDVGFGKTEIAMRAAFKAVLDQKQVAVLVPTTVLAFQHYNTMVQRFKDFAINIEFISRFKSAKQTNEILQKLKEGKVDILIGTHKLLSDKVKFNDLGLLVIDEEQRFGVGHKEKMKALKENIDCLTMTATPIPRTLQMSFLGIKDLSLIQTPPPKRQSIKTYLVKEDPLTIQRAIEKELNRGGQIFVVHNKVNDIEDYTAKIKKLVPKAKTLFAHGQMAEKELEKRITQFYDRKYDLLVSTTIIESGIDIPSANTMIVDRADNYGLSQLHQLRGRIGRSDKKAYAYFVVPHGKPLSSIAAKRLKALQTYAEMGAGFSLATSDLEIRGSGDILGPEQSGHIANIGLELYMELLQDAIADLKHEPKTKKDSIEVQTPFNAIIPENYISDTGLRLKYYKKLSNAPSLESLQFLMEEFQDIYGILPQPLHNLFIILEARLHLSTLMTKNIKVASKSITLSFNKEELEQNTQLRNNIVEFFMQRPKVYRFTPDMSVICSFNDKVSPDTLLEFSKYIAQQIEPC